MISSRLDEQLKRQRSAWERGLTIIGEFETQHTVVVMLSTSTGWYRCHRYFTIGGKWEISVDCASVGLGEALVWLWGQAAEGH